MKTMTDEQRKFAEENHGLIFKFLSKYNYSYEEYYDLAAIGYCNAVLTYKKDNTKFGNYSFVCMKNEIRKYLTEVNGKKKIPKECICSLHEKIYNNISSDNKDCDTREYTLCVNYNNTENEAFLNIDIKSYLERLDKKNREIIYLSYEGYRTEEIMKRTGFSGEWVRQVKNSFKRYLMGDQTAGIYRQKGRGKKS